jgi:BirA family transcriptional regulator, biotin operon repressor / biotin---[acetyl-CoA-carboxylase] ligase
MNPPVTFDLQSVHRLLRTRRLGRELVYLAVTGSTMDIAREQARAGVPEGYAVMAEEQTAGRGRLGRVWVAPPGVNLSVSVLLRPTPGQMKRLGMIVPLAVADAVTTVSGLESVLKWPNDVRINGRKLCGILIEAAMLGDAPSFAVAGIGLNVNLDAAAHPEIAAIATSIATELGRPVSREHTLAALLNALERHYDRGDVDALRREWRSRLETLGQEVAVTFAGHTERGVAEDVNEDGSLLLRLPDGRLRTFPAGEVTLREPA